MNPPTAQGSVSPPWFLIFGLVAGLGFVGYIVWDSMSPSTSAKVVVVTLDNWQKEVIESDVPVLVDFTAVWCGPCKAFTPTVNRLAEKYHGKVKIAKFDVGDQSFNKAGRLADKYGIRGVPHVMIFKGGPNPVQEFQGAYPEATLVRALDAVLEGKSLPREQ